MNNFRGDFWTRDILDHHSPKTSALRPSVRAGKSEIGLPSWKTALPSSARFLLKFLQSGKII